MKTYIIDQVETLLINNPDVRDSYENLYEAYIFHFWNGTRKEFEESHMRDTIKRESLLIQKRNPKARGDKYRLREINKQLKELDLMLIDIKSKEFKPFYKKMIDWLFRF